MKEKKSEALHLLAENLYLRQNAAARWLCPKMFKPKKKQFWPIEKKVHGNASVNTGNWNRQSAYFLCLYQTYHFPFPHTNEWHGKKKQAYINHLIDPIFKSKENSVNKIELMIDVLSIDFHSICFAAFSVQSNKTLNEMCVFVGAQGSN